MFTAALAACGGDDGAAPAAASTVEEVTTDGPEDDETAPEDDEPQAPGSTGVNGAGGSDVGVSVCETIGSVQADLLPDAVSAAYLAQFVGGLDPSLYQEDLDAAAQETCPEDYRTFLEQAEISSLREL